MWIEYVLNGKRKDVKPAVAKALIKVKAAREVADGYLTRDMADQPKVIKKQEVADVDSAGNAWNAELHVASKLKNNNGTWRKKPGAAAAQESGE